MGIILGLMNNTIVRYILIAIAFMGFGFIGGCQYNKNKMAADIAKIQNKQLVETKALQVKVDGLTQDLYNKNLENQTKYESLQNEFEKVSNNLSSCQLTNKQLQLVISSSTQGVRSTSNIGKQYITSTNAGQPANFTCQDLGVTIIEHDRMYFEAKDRLDALQKIMRDILKANK